MPEYANFSIKCWFLNFFLAFTFVKMYVHFHLHLLLLVKTRHFALCNYCTVTLSSLFGALNPDIAYLELLNKTVRGEYFLTGFHLCLEQWQRDATGIKDNNLLGLRVKVMASDYSHLASGSVHRRPSACDTHTHTHSFPHTLQVVTICSPH